MTETIREQVVETLVSRITGISITGFPTGPTVLRPLEPYGYQFSDVWREPPDQLSQGKRAVAVVLEEQETKTDLNFPVVECQLMVFVEVHVMRDQNESMSRLLSRYMGAIERMIRSDRQLGGIAVDSYIIGAEVSPQGPYKSYGSGVLRMQLRYRHHTEDPRYTVAG